jgi:hypothetical protein
LFAALFIAFGGLMAGSHFEHPLFFLKLSPLCQVGGCEGDATRHCKNGAHIAGKYGNAITACL